MFGHCQQPERDVQSRQVVFAGLAPVDDPGHSPVSAEHDIPWVEIAVSPAKGQLAADEITAQSTGQTLHSVSTG